MSNPSDPSDPSGPPPADEGDALDDTLVRGPLPLEEPAPASKRRAGILAAAIGGGLLLLIGAIYLAGFLMAGDRLPKDAQIAGVDVGGMPTSAAIEKLKAALEPRVAEPIPVAVSDVQAEVSPADAGLSVDYAASAELAGGGRSLDPRHIWRALTGGAPTDAVVVADDAKLTAAVAALAKQVDREPANAALAFDGATLKLTPASEGIELDQGKTADALRAGLLSDQQPVQLPAKLTEPEVTTAEATEVADSYAKPAVSGPVTLRAGSAGSTKITPAMIGDSIVFVVADGTLKPELDPDKLRKAAEDALAEIESERPRDATVRLVDGKPKVIPAVDGTTIATADLAAAVEAALTKTGKERVADVQLTGAKAEFTTEDAEKLGIKRVTGQFTTYFPYAYYRNVNISRAAKKINNTLLKPGEVFSLNQIVGERTAANGFVEGYIIQGGKFKKELGGGVSQSATTAFNAMFFAGLTDIQHQPHTLYIDRYPPGREATVAWPTLDLRFGNDTKYGVLVQAYVNKATPGSKGSITVRMWSSKTYDEIDSSKLAKSNFTTGRRITDDDPKCEAQAPVPGFDVNYSRIFRDDGKVVKTEKFFWRYAPTNQIVCK